MIEEITIKYIITELFRFLDLIKSKNIERNEQVDIALKKTYEAIVATKDYIPEHKDRNKECDIATLWNEASISMRHIDKELSKILSYKGEYWSNPDEWDKIKSGKLDISLDNVVKLNRQLLLK